MERQFMLNEQARDRAEFRCQSAVDRFFGAKIPLSAGSAKSYPNP
jgi:hypothetical protein